MPWILRSMAVSLSVGTDVAGMFDTEDIRHSASDLPQSYRGYTSRVSAAIGLGLGLVTCFLHTPSFADLPKSW